MDLNSKKYQMLKELYVSFAENEVKPLATELDEEERFPYETVEKMAKAGMMGIPYPKEYGGEGGDTVGYIMAVEELSRVCGTTGVYYQLIHLLAHGLYINMVMKNKNKNS